MDLKRNREGGMNCNQWRALWTQLWSFWFHNMLGSWMDGLLLDSQEGLGSMELAGYWHPRRSNSCPSVYCAPNAGYSMPSAFLCNTNITLDIAYTRCPRPSLFAKPFCTLMGTSGWQANADCSYCSSEDSSYFAT
jgi:hypothetical protein